MSNCMIDKRLHKINLGQPAIKMGVLLVEAYASTTTLSTCLSRG